MKNEILEQKIRKTVEWLREQVAQSHTRGLILGISGGIDSAVVGFLIKMACPDNSLGVIMPIKSSEKDMEHAKELVEKANLTHMTLDLTQAHSLMLGIVKETMQDAWREDFARISDANTRARLRMTGLYTIANNLGYLVVGTDNAAEIYTGYFTKYGDGGVDVLPIAHLKKSEVYEWAEYLGVPQSILDKAPSADLWEGQTDEIEMGTTYRFIDAFLDGQEVPEKDREVIERLHRNSEHKRHTASVPPKF
ncbi:NAD(+) synthase [Filifactor alocis]